MKKPIVFWGGTGQSKVLKEIVSDEYDLVAIVDNQEIKNVHGDVDILKGKQGLLDWLDIQPDSPKISFAVAIGGHRGRERVALLGAMQSLGLSAITIIHTSAFVSKSATIGDGSQILANSSVCVDVSVGAGCIINTSASVDHDCILGAGVHIGPGAKLAGEISVGEGTFIGTGATILPGLTLGSDVIIGAGAVVTKNVDNGVKMIGNPAREISKV